MEARQHYIFQAHTLYCADKFARKPKNSWNRFQVDRTYLMNSFPFAGRP